MPLRVIMVEAMTATFKNPGYVTAPGFYSISTHPLIKRLSELKEISQIWYRLRPNIRFGSVRFGNSVDFSRFGKVRFRFRLSEY